MPTVNRFFAVVFFLLGITIGPAHIAGRECETQTQESSLLHRRLDLGGVRVFLPSKNSWTPLKPERGKVYIFHLWAVECAPCVAEMPILRNIEKGWRTDPNVRFYMVSETLDDALVREFWFKTYKDKVPETALIQSTDDRIRELLGTTKQPVTLVLDADYVVRQAFIGTLNERGTELAQGVTRLLKSQISSK